MMKAELPLIGVTVVELSDNASLPFCGQILAGLGADVWKVERPAGDASRKWGPSQWKGSGAAFHALNRGKKSICVDIKNPEQVAALHQLIERHADVFMHNLRPGSAAQYGLDAESLRKHKPELVYSELGAFGHVGPMNKDPGYDPLMQAFSGIMSLTGEEGQPPVRSGVSIIDFGTGLWTVIGILAALYRRQQKHIGATVNSSLLETAVAWMSIGIANYAADGSLGSRHGSGIAFMVPHRAFTAADGYLVVSAGNENLFSKLCEALGNPEWASDPKFATNAARLQNRAEIDELIGARIAEHTREFWKEHLDACGIPNAPVQTVAELCAHEQIKALGILDKPSDEEIALPGLPLSFDSRRPPPLHSARDKGMDNKQLCDLLSTRLFEEE
jgi:crotonobetainyl-CoA:carnitine CoA-transferase CaiB-like acyl-CoA transferase